MCCRIDNARPAKRAATEPGTAVNGAINSTSNEMYCGGKVTESARETGAAKPLLTSGDR